MPSKSPNELGAAEAARMIAEGRLTAEALVRSCLERIDAREREVHAWVAFDPDLAIAEARARDRAGTRGPLHGIPVGFKDVIDTATLPTEYNSPIWRGHRPKADASCVATTRAAGGVVLGKTATTEFAYQHPSAARNPHNLAHTPGGSSSGSAAAVADAMVPIALGTQTGGSTIRPAAFCGVVGYKPSFGTINRAGLKFVAESLDTIGIMARSVEDVALAAHAIGGIAAADLATRPSRAPRIGFYRSRHWNDVDAATRALLERSATALGRAGASVHDLDPPPGFEALHDDHAVIIDYECARALAWEYAEHRDGLSAAITKHVETGRAFTRSRYETAMRNAVGYRARMREVFERFDVLLTPSARGEAPEGIASTGDSLMNKMWSLLGLPCVTLPVAKGPKGLPLGIQLVGPHDEDATTFVWAQWVAQALS